MVGYQLWLKGKLVVSKRVPISNVLFEFCIRPERAGLATDITILV